MARPDDGSDPICVSCQVDTPVFMFGWHPATFFRGSRTRVSLMGQWGNPELIDTIPLNALYDETMCNGMTVIFYFLFISHRRVCCYPFRRSAQLSKKSTWSGPTKLEGTRRPERPSRGVHS